MTTMRRVVASIAGCLACAGSVTAAEVVLDTGIEGFQVKQPAPTELLQKIGPLLGAAGSEELRVAPVFRYAANADLIDGRGRPVDATIWLDQLIQGREVRQGFVLIGFNTRTHEVTLLDANFLPDRGLHQEPRLTATRARAKIKAQLPDPTAPLTFDYVPPQLAYEVDGNLVWIFEATRTDLGQPHQISVDAVTGRVVRVRVQGIGCFSTPGEWVDLPR